MSSLEFTLNISDCLGCGFCPQEKLGRAYHSEKRAMTVEDFKTILDKLPMDCQVDFSGFSECFLNPDVCKMIELAARSGRRFVIYSTLVNFRKCCVDVLKAYPPNVFRVHVPDGEALKFPEERWVEYHELFLMSRVGASYMAMRQPSDFIKRYLAIKNIPLEIPTMLSRGGNLEHVAVREINGPIKCTMNRWHNNVVLPNGDVYGCCMNYDLSVYLGNLLRQPYSEIHWEAEKWSMAMNKDATGTICSKCEWACPA
jgi:radical SAM protein with 4Fe4S-binding SPASM domain